MPHLALARLLLERNTECLETRTRRLDVVDGNRDVSESSAGVAISTGVALEVGVAFRAVVVRQFKDSLMTTKFTYFHKQELLTFARKTRGLLLLGGQIATLMIEREEIQREIGELLL